MISNYKLVLLTLATILLNCVSTKNISVEFHNKLPEYKENEIELIKKARPQIDPFLKNPNDYYYSEIKTTDTIIRIKIGRLEELQLFDLKNKKKNITYTFYTDDSETPRTFLFNNKMELIECLDNFGHKCK